MKTLILMSIIMIAAAIADGCQDKEDKVYKERSLYLRKAPFDIGVHGGWRSGYCMYKMFEDMHRRVVIDTICIYCVELDSAYFACINETDYRFVWDQEYHPEDSTMTWKPMYIEKISNSSFGVCAQCPERKKKYIKTSYGYIW
jgi:hypothetical protein